MFDLKHPPNCPQCGDRYPEYLGPLGALHWFRCRDCGLGFTLESQNEKQQEGEES